MTATAVGRLLGAGALVTVGALASVNPVAHAEKGETHITGQGIVRTIDCNESTLIVLGVGNQVFAVGNCWAVTVQGSGNVIVADNVINDITVYGSDQTVFYKNGAPIIWDRGRELGMTNRIDRVPT